MKAFILCMAMLLLANPLVFADKIIVIQDSLIDQTDFKHNKEYFLDHYGTDDSTRALINTFFKARKAAVVEVVYSVVGGVGLYLFVDHVLGPGENKSNSWNTVILAIFAIPLIPAFAVGIAEGTITYLIYNRQKLLHLIADYQQGKHLPRRVTHRARYRQEFRKVKGIKPTIWNILLST